MKYLDLTGLQKFWTKIKTTGASKITLNDYTKSGYTGALAETDTLNSALAKLENAVNDAAAAGVQTFAGKTGAIGIDSTTTTAGAVKFAMGEDKILKATVNDVLTYTSFKSYIDALDFDFDIDSEYQNIDGSYTFKTIKQEDGKITTVTVEKIQIAESQVTGLTTNIADLKAKDNAIIASYTAADAAIITSYTTADNALSDRIAAIESENAVKNVTETPSHGVALDLSDTGYVSAVVTPGAFAANDGDVITGGAAYAGTWAMIDALELNPVTVGADSTLASISEVDGKVSTSAVKIQIAESQVTDLTTHLGNKVETSVAEDATASDKLVKASTVDSKISTAFTQANNTQSDAENGVSVTVSQTNYKIDSIAIAGVGTAATKTAYTGTIGIDDTATDDLVSAKQVATFVKTSVADLAGAMHFKAGDRDDQTNPQAGDVVIESDNKEYVYDGSKWVELGDESIYALKSTTIAGNALSADISASTLRSSLNVADGAVKVEDSTTNGNIKVTGPTGTSSEITVYEHPVFTATGAAAVKVGNDAAGHVVLGDALAASDIAYNGTITVQAAIEALQLGNSGLDSRLTTAEGEIDELQTTVGQHASQITALQATDTAYNTRITANETAIATLNGDGSGSVIKTVNDAITALHLADTYYSKTAGEANATDIEALKTTTATHTTDITDLKAADAAIITAYETADSALDARITTNTTNIATINGKFSTIAASTGLSVVSYSADGIITAGENIEPITDAEIDALS